MINFFGPSASFVRDVEYFEPKACVTHSDLEIARQLWMHYDDFQVWAMPTLNAWKNGPNWVTGFDSSDSLIVSAKENPVYVRIHNTTVDKVKKYMAQNPDR